MSLKSYYRRLKKIWKAKKSKAMSTTVINFVFESGISLIIFTLVYLLFLRKETFFMLNRIYLMAAVIFSVLLPFVHFQANSALPSVMLGEVTVTAMRYQNLLQTISITP